MDRVEWRNSYVEEIIDPQRPIIDPHHHIWDESHMSHAGRYTLVELGADLDSGHNIVGTVYVDALENYSTDGPEEFRPVGETAYANSVAEQARKQGFRTEVCAGIVSNIQLDLPNVGDVLDAHLAAAPQRLRGCRHIMAAYPLDSAAGRRKLYDEPAVRTGMRELARRGLSFDAYTFHLEIPQVTRLAQAFPDTTIILNHIGSPLGIGPYAGRLSEAWEEWRPLIKELAGCPNVCVKLGGSGMPLTGYGWERRDHPASSDEMANAVGDGFKYVIDQFGPQRCMFESNFPVDGLSIGYAVLWNSFKKIAAEYSEAEKDALFFGTANRAYRLGLVRN